MSKLMARRARRAELFDDSSYLMREPVEVEYQVDAEPVCIDKIEYSSVSYLYTQIKKYTVHLDGSIAFGVHTLYMVKHVSVGGISFVVNGSNTMGKVVKFGSKAVEELPAWLEGMGIEITDQLNSILVND